MINNLLKFCKAVFQGSQFLSGVRLFLALVLYNGGGGVCHEALVAKFCIHAFEEALKVLMV